MAVLTGAFDAKGAQSAGPNLLPSPISFDGSLEELAERHLLPALPGVDAVLDVHQQLMRYLAQPDPLFLIRQVRGTERRLDYRTESGIRIRATDNSPAWWMYAALRAGHRISPADIAAVVETIPCHMFDVAPRSAPVPSAAGWHIAHILNVKDGNVAYLTWTRREVVRRFLRNIHPLNYFLLPKVDWQRLGNDADIVDYFVGVHRVRYASIWDEFAELSAFDGPQRTGRGGHTRVVFGGETPELTRTRAKPTVPGDTVTYRASRLLFKRDVIEPLPDSGRFRVQTPDGDFEMTKAEFYSEFPRVLASRSYREGGIYHFPSPPRRAERFRVE